MSSRSPSPPPLPTLSPPPSRRPSHSRNTSDFSLSSSASTSGTSSPSASPSPTKPIPFLAARPLKRNATTTPPVAEEGRFVSTGLTSSASSSSLSRRSSVGANAQLITTSSGVRRKSSVASDSTTTTTSNSSVSRRSSLLSTSNSNYSNTTPRRDRVVTATATSPVPPPQAPRSITPPVPTAPLAHKRSVSLLTNTSRGSTNSTGTNSLSPPPQQPTQLPPPPPPAPPSQQQQLSSTLTDNLSRSNSASRARSRYSLPPPSTSPTSLVGLQGLSSTSLFARGLGQLPSPPMTSSDGANSEGAGTVSRTGGFSSSSNATGTTTRGNNGSGAPGLGVGVETTPKKVRGVVPIIERQSPSVAGGSPRSSARSSPERKGRVLAFGGRTSSMLGGQRDDGHGGGDSESDAVTLKAEDEEDEERELRLVREEEERERRRIKRLEVREKNQRILDSINSSSNTPSSQTSPPASSTSSSPRRKTTSTIRRSTVAPLNLPSSFSSSSLSNALASTSQLPPLPGSATEDTFGPSRLVSPTKEGGGVEQPFSSTSSGRKRSSTVIVGGLERRESLELSSSPTTSGLSRSQTHRDRERRIRTLGRTSGLESRTMSLTERPASAASGSFNFMEDREKWRSSTPVSTGSTLVNGAGSGGRARTAIGDNVERDRAFAGSMRRLGNVGNGSLDLGAGGERVGPRSSTSMSTRRRRVSSDFEGIDRSGTGNGNGTMSGGRSSRPSLPSEFVRRTEEPSELERPSSRNSNATATTSEWAEKDPDWSKEYGKKERGQQERSTENGGTDVFQSGLRKLEGTTRATGTQRYGHIAAELQERKDRLRSRDVGSENWLAEVNDLRTRAKSRASGSSGDSRRYLDSGGPPPQTPSVIDRDRTLRAINAALASQGLTINPIDDSSVPQSAPGRMSSTSFYSPTDPSSSSSRRRKSSGGLGLTNLTNYESTPPHHSGTGLSRANSVATRSGAESSRSMYFGTPGGPQPEHHKLLQQAFEHFDSHFVPPDGGGAPESTDLVKRMSSLVQATTKLNAGLRALAASTVEAQIEAELDERAPSSSRGAGLFEKHVNALVRGSDDQVRSLTEGLIAFTRVERERDRLRRDGIELGRPASRASLRGGPLHTSPKRPATSSPFHEPSLSMSAIRPNFSRQQSLRDPLAEPNDPSSSSSRRTTQSFSGGVRSPRSPYMGHESPTPASGGAGRRDTGAFMRSPLSGGAENLYTRPGTPSRAATLDLPMPSPSEDSQARRAAKSSTNSNATVRPSGHPPALSGPSSIRFPGSPPTAASSLLDPTNATTETSPTRVREANLPRSSHGLRTFSEADRPEFTYESIGMGLDRTPDRERERDRESWRHTLSASSGAGFSLGATGKLDQEIDNLSSSPEEGRRGRQRLSTGSIGVVGAALRTGLSSLVGMRGRRDTIDSLPPMFEGGSAASETTNQTSTSSGSGSPEERRRERRKEVEGILRRTQARSSIS